MNFIDKLANELLEGVVSKKAKLSDLMPVELPKPGENSSCKGGKCNKPGSGEAQRKKVIGKQAPPKGKQPSKPGEGKPGESKPGESKPGESKPGESKPGESSSGKKGQTGGQTDLGKEVGQSIKDVIDGIKEGGKKSDVNNGKVWMDDHSKIEKSDGTIGGLLKRVYKEATPKYRKRQIADGKSGSEGLDTMSRVQMALKESFDISSIINKLTVYKRKMADAITKNPSYYGGVFNPLGQQTNRPLKGTLKQPLNKPNSVVLFFVADTSGSITPQDYESIAGYLNDIAKSFEKTQFGIKGEVYLMEWSDIVHTPVRKWKIPTRAKKLSQDQIEKKEKLYLRTGGGNDANKIFEFIDKHFYRKDAKGNPTFVFDPKSDTFKWSSNPEEDRAARIKAGDDEVTGKAISTKLKQRRTTGKEKKSTDRDFQTTKESKINMYEPTFNNAPFVIVYTDGLWSTPTYESKLFKNAPGNILWICTTKSGIKNLKPKNFVYHDLHGDDL